MSRLSANGPELARLSPILASGLVNVDTGALSERLDQIIHEVRQDDNAVPENCDIPRPLVIKDTVDPVAAAFPVTSCPGGYANRSIVCASVLSDHALGKANMDAMRTRSACHKALKTIRGPARKAGSAQMEPASTM